ncbi:hypothetical protein Poly41_70100 [Novipirellula artificiosorum]|uniref:Uncharacterized protein n=1 Tax=Novipirellula artificiosorum TaxID=2528016 RepID=A0A5C6CY68_9BACT|nr:hypothetical protein Poly41_70100 [Novipirellula artificiosorum]
MTSTGGRHGAVYKWKIKPPGPLTLDVRRLGLADLAPAACVTRIRHLSVRQSPISSVCLLDAANRDDRFRLTQLAILA